MHLSLNSLGFGGTPPNPLNLLLGSAAGQTTSTSATGAATSSTSATGASAEASATANSQATSLAGSTAATQFASGTLAGLLALQQINYRAPTTSDLASKMIQGADGNGDGQLSLTEVEGALSGAAATDTSAVTAAFNKIDANGDGELSNSELSTALNAVQGQLKGAHHHGRHASSSQVASEFTTLADGNGDGELSSSEVASALGVNASDSAFASAFGKLDSNGDGQLSVAELTAGLQAFRQSFGAAAPTSASAPATKPASASA